LRDTVVRAPIDGRISEKRYELGEMAEKGKPVFRIDNPAALEFSAHLAEQYYARVAPGVTALRLRVSGRPAGEFPLSYRSPTVHAALRTFEIKCRLPAPPPELAPGMMADAEVVLAEREGRGVPASVPVERGDATLVFVVADGVARAVPVETGYETGGWLEVRAGLPADVEAVVGMGQFMLDDGDPVAVGTEAP